MIRGGPERQIANQAITEMISFVKKYRREAVFYFGEGAYIAWFMGEHRYTEDQAKARWLAELGDKRHGRIEDGFGNVRLAVQDHIQEVTETGREQRNIDVRNAGAKDAVAHRHHSETLPGKSKFLDNWK